MHDSDNRYNQPAVPPLYPMDPCSRKPFYDHPIYHDPYDMEPIYNEPYYEPDPVGPNMPYMDYPMMDPHFRECMEVCMRMRCGYYSPYNSYSHTTEFSNEEYEKFKYIDLHKLSPYYIPSER
ncbi:MAG: hypothetical protein GX080_01585 [Tissierellia bacterium]|nr:hypothetical protein [Tissierellia bacterium]